jgi:hypothetical protein
MAWFSFRSAYTADDAHFSEPAPIITHAPTPPLPFLWHQLPAPLRRQPLLTLVNLFHLGMYDAASYVASAWPDSYALVQVRRILQTRTVPPLPRRRQACRLVEVSREPLATWHGSHSRPNL